MSAAPRTPAVVVSALQELRRERDTRLGRRVVRARQRELERQDAIRVEAGADARELHHAGQHQPGRRQQHDREHHLGDDQRRARSSRPARDRSATNCSAHRESARGLCSATTQPKATPRTSVTASANSATLASMSTDADAGRLAANSGSSARSDQRPSSRPAAPPSDENTRHSASACENSRDARRAERRADGRFVTPRCRAGDEQRRRVRARDQQQQHDAAGDHEQRRPDCRDRLFGHRHEAGADRAMGVGMLRGHARGERLELRRRAARTARRRPGAPRSCSCG